MSRPPAPRAPGAPWVSLGDPRGPHFEFLLVLALCHTMIVEEDSGSWQAESPDELALVQAASDFGWRFVGRMPGRILVQRVGAATYRRRHRRRRRRLGTAARIARGAQKIHRQIRIHHEHAAIFGRAHVDHAQCDALVADALRSYRPPDMKMGE
jgi:hypothetical protein